MKKILFLFVPVIIATLLVSCKNETKPAAAKADSVAMPYKAAYSSSWAISDSTKIEAAVLQSYKDWEDNKLANASAYFADTVAGDMSDGMKFKVRRDSMIHIMQKYRDSLSSSKIDMIAITNLHSTDKNEDWVSVWYKQTDTHKSGKVDSTFYNDVNRVKNGKIDYFTSFRQKLKAK